MTAGGAGVDTESRSLTLVCRDRRLQAAACATMILQAAGLAVLAAISPTALLVAAVYLGSARPRLVGTLYLAGAIIMSLVMGLVVIAILRNTGLSHRSEHTPRYGLRLGLGVVLLAAGAVLARRKPKPPDPDKKQGLVSRMIADPAPASAFAVGLLLFAPGLTFIAALQVIATANADIEYTTVAIVLVVIINAAFVWLPLLLHLIAPGMTTTAPDGLQRLAAREREQDPHRGAARGRGHHGRQRHLRAGRGLSRPAPGRLSPPVRPAGRCSGAPHTPQSLAVRGAGPGTPGR